jgi:hypothetical protein
MTRDDIIRMAREAGYKADAFGVGHWDMPECEKFAALVAAHEREECAKVAENGLIGHTIAKVIRARGEK